MKNEFQKIILESPFMDDEAKRDLIEADMRCIAAINKIKELQQKKEEQ